MSCLYIVRGCGGRPRDMQVKRRPNRWCAQQPTHVLVPNGCRLPWCISCVIAVCVKSLLISVTIKMCFTASILTYLDDNIRHTVPDVGSSSWVPLLHTHRKLHVRLFGSVAFAVGALSQRLGDDQKGNIHSVLEKLRNDLKTKRGSRCGEYNIFTFVTLIATPNAFDTMLIPTTAVYINTMHPCKRRSYPQGDTFISRVSTQHVPAWSTGWRPSRPCRSELSADTCRPPQ